MVLGGAFHIYLGYWSFQIDLGYISYPILFPFNTIVGTLMIVLGVLTFAASLAVWLQKSWASKTIAGIGVASCVALIIFGYYLMIIVVGLVYWAAIDHIRANRVTELSDWDDD
ncbi:MAG: hypothetical protein ACXACG_06590 [Candidatus Thorarchaeota archaeon]|jgi:apolipoprotein N-acyltransferase